MRSPARYYMKYTCGELNSKKEFDREISFWFMENGNNI